MQHPAKFKLLGHGLHSLLCYSRFHLMEVGIHEEVVAHRQKIFRRRLLEHDSKLLSHS
jgi:hypothetical protein